MCPIPIPPMIERQSLPREPQKQIDPLKPSITSNHYVARKTEVTDIHKILSERALFDSIGAQFHLSVFCFQFIAHVFPLILYIFSPNRYAQGITMNFRAIQGNIIAPLAMIISFLLCPHEDKDLLGYSVYFPAMFFLVHRVTVAFKYASMSPTEYERFMSCKDPDLISSYISQLQLLSGWLTMDNLVLTFELSSASARLGAKINEIYFRIGSNLQDPMILSHFRHWNAFLRGHERIDTDSKPAREIKKLPNGNYLSLMFVL